ncbi:hypothetical protein [Paenibacillus woosongensis]|uniref:hypothetical protein n=1 Tax=Paenibacillus woosongensis TaxID=307580 RepID=UPI0018C24C36|nr:hypothetical protein [Paenibacillus woosongensis]
MKAVPKVGLDGLYIEDVLVDDAFSGVVPFYAIPPESDASGVDVQSEEVEPEPAGYIVGVPVPPGLFRPHFDLAAWEAYQDAVTAAEEEYQAANTEWGALPEEKRGKPPIYTAPEQPELWGEGLTLEEIEALHPPQEPSEMELLSNHVAKLILQNTQQQETIENTGAELADLKSSSEEQRQTVNTLGTEQIKQDLSTLDLKQQNAVLGAELVKKDISILDLYIQNQVLGQMVAALELKLLATKGIGGEE